MVNTNILFIPTTFGATSRSLSVARDSWYFRSKGRSSRKWKYKRQ